MVRAFVFGVPGDDAEGFIEYSVSILKGGTETAFIRTEGKSEEEVLQEIKGGNVIVTGNLLKPTVLGFKPQLGSDFFRKAGIDVIIFIEFWSKPGETRELHNDIEIIKRDPAELKILEETEAEAKANKSYATACSAASKALFKLIRVNKADIKKGLEEIGEFYKGVF